MDKIKKYMEQTNDTTSNLKFTLIIGDNERDNNLVSFRKYGSEKTFSMSIDENIKYIKEEIMKR